MCCCCGVGSVMFVWCVLCCILLLCFDLCALVVLGLTCVGVCGWCVVVGVVLLWLVCLDGLCACWLGVGSCSCWVAWVCFVVRAIVCAFDCCFC